MKRPWQFQGLFLISDLVLIWSLELGTFLVLVSSVLGALSQVNRLVHSTLSTAGPSILSAPHG